MNENTIKREDLEERFDDVDWKNYKVYAAQEAGKLRKETKYSVFWTGLHTYDGENVEAEIHISAETAGPENINLDESIIFPATNPVEGIQEDIEYYTDVLNEDSFIDKADSLGFDVDSLSMFPMNVDTYCLIMLKYLSDLKEELAGKKIDLTDFN